MKVIPLGAGTFPAVAWQSFGWRVAIGGNGRVDSVDLDAFGHVLSVASFADGFGFPTVSGDWLGYKSSDVTGSVATLRHLATTAHYTFDPAGGNIPLVLSAHNFAWQLPAPYPIRHVALDAPEHPYDTSQLGAPDGLAWIISADTVALIKDVRTSVPGLLNPQSAGLVTVGEQPDIVRNNWPLGMAIAYAPMEHWRGWLLGGQFCNTPRIAGSPDGQRVAFVTWGAEGVRLILLDVQELVTLPAPPSAPGPDQQPPNPTPEPIPMDGITDAQFADLQALRKQYPATLDPVQAGTMINEWTWRHRGEGLGMQRKEGGTHAIQPTTGIGIWNGVRIIRLGVHTGQDVFGGASVGLYTPTRGTVDKADQLTFVTPVSPAGAPTPPDPGPTPQPPDDGLLERVANLEAQVAHLEGLVSQCIQSGRKIALQTDNGHYLCAEGGGGGEVNATRVEPGGWESFTVKTR